MKDTVCPRTFERYAELVRKHIAPALGRVKLRNFTAAHARGLYRDKFDSGLSPRTVQYIHVTLHKALKRAVADGLILRNVCEAVKAPQVCGEEYGPWTVNGHALSSKLRVVTGWKPCMRWL